MDKYIVSARKYRPQTWSDVVGQNALTTTLKNAVQTGKLAHAFLFCGPRGVGKTTCARILARTINCSSPTENGDACGRCECCIAQEEGRSFNVYELDAASNNSVDDIRMLIDQVRMAPQVGRYKVFIIDEVHMLSPAAFNAFLKTLEEPPAHAIFILATTEKHKILPTILSRCQIYDFSRMETTGIVDHLKYVAQCEGITYEPQALDVIARKADGGMRDALSIFDQVARYAEGNITYKKVIEDLNILDYDYYFRLTDEILSKDIPAVMITVNEILSKGFEGGHLISGFASHLRDLMVSQNDHTLPLLEVADDTRDRYREQASRCKTKFVYKALKLCNDCDMSYRTAGNKRLLVELTLIQVVQAVDDDTPGCGLGPTKILKPIFAALVNQTTTAAVPAQNTTARPTKETTPTSIAPTQSTPSVGVRTATTATAKKAAVKRLSIRAISDAVNNQTDTSADTHQEVIQMSDECTPFDDNLLSYWWHRYAATLPKEENATAGRMKNMYPKLNGQWRVEVPVENGQVLKDMNEQHARLLSFLSLNLKNGKIDLVFRIVEKTDQRRKIFSKREQMAVMKKNNKVFEEFCKIMGLELDM